MFIHIHISYVQMAIIHRNDIRVKQIEYIFPHKTPHLSSNKFSHKFKFFNLNPIHKHKRSFAESIHYFTKRSTLHFLEW